MENHGETRARIIVLDPAHASRQLIGACLERAGYHVRLATSADEVIAAFRRERADLVILGAEPELAPRLRDLGGRTSVAILLVRGADDLDRTELACGAGTSAGDDFVVRPVRGTELLARVESLLRLKQIRDELRDRVHNLKNPLSAILVNCQYLMRHLTMATDVREVVGEIAESAAALNRNLSGRRASAH